MGQFADDLERIKAKYGTLVVPEPSTPVEFDAEKAFVMESHGRTLITAPVREIAGQNDGFMYVHGRFVEADNPNGNGAYWSTADLEMGEPTVAGGPLNWLHQERRIIGSLLNGKLIRPERQEAGPKIGNHIQSTAAVWQFLFPQEALTIEKASADRQLFYSMECVSKEVECVAHEGSPGCGESFPYATWMRDKASVCEHLREGSSARRFKEPVFLGGAIIIPPVRPGWAHADAEVVRQAAAATESLDLEIGRQAAAQLAEQILLWAETAG